MPDLTLDYTNVLSLCADHLDPNRSESASFLIWYLENYYRLDRDVAVDCICDQPGDKGIDGIYVDDDMQVIYVFQAKLTQKPRTLGDVALKEFSGTLNQLASPEAVTQLMDSADNTQLASLLSRLNIADKVTDYDIRGDFVCNMDPDDNGTSYLQHVDNIVVSGKSLLTSSFVSSDRDVPVPTPIAFDISGFQLTEYAVDTEVKAFIAPIRSRELVELSGISNQSIFTHNVRGPLGHTKVNRDITKSINDSALHKQFPLFHNGITIIAGEIRVTDTTLEVADYFVVNGCQSLTALYRHAKDLTDDLFVLTKFIRVDPSSALATQITEFSNNQNGVKARDFKANSVPQIRLQNEFRSIYKDAYGYEIKRGELEKAKAVISNEEAGLYLMAFDLKEPWGTHRKYQIFDEKHTEIFSRPSVTADRIVMLHTCREEIGEIVEEINTVFSESMF